MNIITATCGAVVGLSLGLTGGGGAIFAVPLLVYALDVDPRAAIGVSLVTVGLTSFVGFGQRLRLGAVEVRTGLLFAVAGMLTAPFGAWLAARLPESLLLVAFAALMLVIAARMWRKADDASERLPIACADEPGPRCRRDPQGVLHLTSRCALLLGLVGMGSGLLTGLFGIGGGFIIVPALVLFSGMGIQKAVGTSLLVIALVSLSGVVSLLVAERAMPWEIVVWFAVGSIVGLFLGGKAAQRLGGPTLQRVFAVAILGVGLFVLIRNLAL